MRARGLPETFPCLCGPGNPAPTKRKKIKSTHTANIFAVQRVVRCCAAAANWLPGFRARGDLAAGLP